MSEFLSWGGLVVSSVSAIVFFIGFIIPLIYTAIPYWKEFGSPSHVMLSRISFRFGLFLLALVQTARSVPLIFPEVAPSLLAIRAILIVLYLLLVSTFVATWLNHPRGIADL